MKNRSIWRKLELFIILKNNLLYCFILQKAGWNLFKIFVWFVYENLAKILTLLLPQIHPNFFMETFLHRCEGDSVFGKFSLFFCLLESFSLYLQRHPMNVGEINTEEAVAEKQQNGN